MAMAAQPRFLLQNGPLPPEAPYEGYHEAIFHDTHIPVRPDYVRVYIPSRHVSDANISSWWKGINELPKGSVTDRQLVRILRKTKIVPGENGIGPEHYPTVRRILELLSKKRS